MSKVLLRSEAHMLQMLGAFDSTNGYALPKDIVEILIKMPKKPIISKDEIDIGTNVAFLRSDCGIEFCLRDSVLSLVERAEEMGGLISFTYLTPLTGINEEYFLNLDTNIDITPIKERQRQRRERYTKMLAEHENLARSAMRRTNKILSIHPVPEFKELLDVGKRFIRKGKPDFNSAQLQVLGFILDKGSLTHPAQLVINRWKTACNNKTSAQLLIEPPVELRAPEILEVKKSKTTKGKHLDFRSLLAAMMKQDAPKKLPVRLKPSKKVAEMLTAEHEIEGDFVPEEQALPKTESQTSSEEIELQQLVSQLLEKRDGKQSAETAHSLGIAKKRSRASLVGKKQEFSAEHAPASLNPDLEQ